MTSTIDADWFDIVTTFEDNLNDYLETQKRDNIEDIQDDDDEYDSLLNQFGNKYYERRSASQYRKDALTTVMGGFIEGGTLFNETDWEFRELFPLEHHVEESADILLGKPTNGAVILVVLLPERRSPDTLVQTTRKCITAAKRRKETLSEGSVPIDDDRISSAIVVNPPRGNETDDAIENSSSTDEIYIWRVYDQERAGDKEQVVDTLEEKVLDEYTRNQDIINQSNTTDDELSTLLKESVVISREGKEVLPDFFLDSHHSIFLEHILGHVVRKREARDDAPLTHFSKSEIIRYVERTIFSIDKEEEAEKRVDRLIARWRSMGTIKRIDSSKTDLSGKELFRFAITSTKKPQDIIEDIQEDYSEDSIKFMIEVEAMERALDDYFSKYGEQALMERYTGN